MAWRAWPKVRDLLHEVGARVSLEWSPSDQQLVEDDAQAEDVAAAIDTVSLATSLLWTHVSRRPSILGAVADVLFFERQAEIDHKRLAGGVEEDVAGFDVSVNESLAVS